MRSSSKTSRSPRSSRSLALALAASSLLAACGDSGTEPRRTTLPPAAELEAAAADISALLDRPELSLIRGDGAVVLSVGQRLQPGIRASLGRVGGLTTSRVQVSAQMAEVAPFGVPEEVLGLTFTGYPEWTVDTLANGEPVPGAPANGARFLLPSVDEFGDVVDEHVATMDVVNVSTADGVGVKATVRTLDGDVILELTDVVREEGETLVQTYSGFVADGNDRYTFDEVKRDDAEGFALELEHAAPFAGFGFTLAMSSSPTAFDLSMELTLNGARLRVEGATEGEDEFSGRLYLDDVLYAEWDENGEVVRGNGEPDEAAAEFLMAMVAIPEVMPSASMFAPFVENTLLVILFYV